MEEVKSEYIFKYWVVITWDDKIHCDIENMYRPEIYNLTEKIKIENMDELNKIAIRKGIEKVLGSDNNE